MRQFKKTLIANAIAQITLISSGTAFAQSEAPQTQTVVISSQRAALESAQKIKKNSDEIVDSIVADDIGKLPDRSITEVLQRIVGVTMDRSMKGDPQHYAVEGSGVNIRGLNYTRSELNGRDSFSANGGRALNFEDVPPELMAGVDVFKNPSAEQIEGAISGLVNLRTAMPFDFKGFKGAISLQESYSTLKKGKPAPSGSLMLSDRWVTGIGEIGALVDLARSQSNTRTDSLKIDPYYPRNDLIPGKTLWVPKGALWRTQDFERTREGQYAAVQWRPFRELTSSLTYFKSKYDMTWSEQFMAMQHPTPDSIQVANGTYDANGVFQSGTLSSPSTNGVNFNPARRVEDRASSTTDIAWNAQWRASPSWTLRADVQNIKAKTVGFASEVATGFQMQKQGLDLTGDLPRMIYDESDLKQMSDPNKYYWGYTMDHNDVATAQSKAARLDLQYDFDHSVLRDLRFGVRLTDRDSIVTNSNPSYNWQGITQPWMIGWNIPHLAFLGDPRFSNGTSTHSFNNFFNGKIAVPAGIFVDESVARNVPTSYDTLHSYHDVLCAEQKAAQGWGDCKQWGTAEGGYQSKPFGTDPAGKNAVSENTKAFYTQLRFGFDDLKYPIDGNIGVRYVRTDSTSIGYTVFTPNLPDTSKMPPGFKFGGVAIPNILPFSGAGDFKNTYSNVLPSLNLRMKANDKLQFRLAFASALTRPDFGQLQGYTNLSEDVKSVTDTATNTINVTGVNLRGDAAGNPMLKPTTSKQIDFTAEWYFAPGGSLTFAAFHKNLKDVIVNQSASFPLPDANGKLYSFTVTSPVNGARGKASGFEIAHQQTYDMLPGWMSGFGTQASYTFVESKRTLYNPVTGEYCSGGAGADNFNRAMNGCDTNGRSFNNLPLEGLSRHSASFALMYEKGPLSARMAYSWRSSYLQAINNSWGTRFSDGLDTNPTSANFGKYNVEYVLPLLADAYGQVDGSIFYKFNDQLSFGLEVQNLTSAVFKQKMMQHTGNQKHAWYATGPRYTAQMRYAF